ncbi:MAG: DUF4139 domain-containing protein [Alphaproteobacteria bacterium]|nr:DUF4139 domain-containing protein [Alphaproteobacteria bacterium]
MKKINLFVALLMGLYSVSAGAENVQQIPVSYQKMLTMTIYNAGRALVGDVRHVDFSTGRSSLSFEDISNMVLPSSVLFKSDNVRVLEQNFNYDLLSLENLMQKSIGQTVNVEYINEASGQVTNQTAQLLAYTNGKPILKIGTKIETNYPGRVVFNQIPENLSAKPSLVFDVEIDKAVNQEVEISYLTEGISWSADYVIELDKNSLLDLNGLVTLTNNTAVSYKNARLQLVAGDLNIVRPETKVYGRRNMQTTWALEEAANVMQESIGGYHLYRLARPTDILSNQTKQVSLLSASGVNAIKTYQFEDIISYFSAQDVENLKPVMYLNFKNTKNNLLGKALPKGVVRVYEKDSKGGLVFVGEDRIEHTAVGQDIHLRLGEDFDITAHAKRLSFKELDSKTSIAEFEVSISNAKPITQLIRYSQYLPDGWKILSENAKSQKENSNKIFWDISVPAEGNVILNFKVRVDKR